MPPGLGGVIPLGFVLRVCCAMCRASVRSSVVSSPSVCGLSVSTASSKFCILCASLAASSSVRVSRVRALFTALMGVCSLLSIDLSYKSMCNYYKDLLLLTKVNLQRGNLAYVVVVVTSSSRSETVIEL